MKTKIIERSFVIALILLSLLFLFSACEGKIPASADPTENADPTASAVETEPAVTETPTDEPDPTDRPGSTPFLTVYTLDRITGERGEPDVYRHLVYAVCEGLCADGLPLIAELPEVIEKLPVISLSAYEIGYNLPTECSANVNNVEVLSTLPSGETVRISFKTLDEALAYAKAHFEDEDACPVIDIFMNYNDRYVKERGNENGEEGYAFRVEP